MNVNDRQFLIDLRDSSKICADELPNPDWKHAFHELAMAADRCDAMIARCINAESVENKQ